MPDERKKILIVEDSPTMQRMYRMVLGSRPGTELLFARDGAEGLDRIAQEPDVGLMIVDVNMPRMDGLEFLRRARSELGVVDVPAIVISTEGEEHDRQAALDAGAAAYLTKPWTPDELLGTLDRITSEAP
jgi:two-component system, chemotaxis family, chemotaxis protein CheY